MREWSGIALVSVLVLVLVLVLVSPAIVCAVCSTCSPLGPALVTLHCTLVLFVTTVVVLTPMFAVPVPHYMVQQQ